MTGGASDQRPNDGGPPHVLVVDDHGDTATLVARVLTAAGYAVLTARGYGTALAAARAERPRVLVCDLGLPDGDGCDLLAEIRATHAVRAIAVTGHASDEHRRRCRDAGYERFLIKPVPLDALVTAVGELVGTP